LRHEDGGVNIAYSWSFRSLLSGFSA
jgi:hypothetical protein